MKQRALLLFLDLLKELPACPEIELIPIYSSVKNRIKPVERTQRQHIEEYLLKKEPLNKVLGLLGWDLHFDDVAKDFIPCEITNQKYGKLYQVAILTFHIICWTHDQNVERTEEQLCIFLKQILSIHQSNRQLTAIINFNIKRCLYTISVYEQNPIELTQKGALLIIEVFNKNNTLTSSFFVLLIDFIKITLHIEGIDQELIIKLIYTIVSNKRPIVFNIDPSPLIFFLHPSILELNHTSLEILAHLASLYNCKRIDEAFMLLPTPLFAMTNEKGAIKFEIPKEKIQNEPFLSRLPFEFVDYHIDGWHGLNAPPIYLVKTTLYLSSILPPKILIGVQNIANCLAKTPSKFMLLFFQSFGELLMALKGASCHIDMCAALVLILQHLPSTYPLKNALPLLFQTDVFDPLLTVFMEEPMDARINLVRSALFGLLTETNQETIHDFLVYASDHPILFAEFVLRVLERIYRFSRDIFGKKDNLIYLIKAPHQLLNLISNGAGKPAVAALETVLGFTFFLLEDKGTAMIFFSSQLFADGFLWLMFAPIMTKAIIGCIRSTYTRVRKNCHQLRRSVLFVTDVLSSICNHISDEKYINLGLELSNAIVDSMILNPNIRFLFAGMPSMFGKLGKSFKRREFFHLFFQVLIAQAETDDAFTIDVSLSNTIVECIHYLEDTVSDITKRNIINLMASCNHVMPNSLFLIRVPSAALLLYNVCEDKVEIIRLFGRLCKFSLVNRSQLSSASIPSAILNSVLTNEIKLTSEIMNILSTIISYETDNSFIKKSSEFIVDQHPVDFMIMFSRCLTKCRGLSENTVKIGAIPVNYIIKGFPNGYFDSPFSIQISLNIDTATMHVSDLKASLVNFIDEKNNIFQLFLDRNSIFLRVKTSETITVLNITRTVPDKEWMSFVVSVGYFEKGVVIKIFQMGSPTITSNLFIGNNLFLGKVKAEVGGYINDSFDERWLGKTIGQIGMVNFFEGQPEDDFKLGPIFKTKPLSLEIKKLKTSHSGANLLEACSISNICNDLCMLFDDIQAKEEVLCIALDIISQIFSYSYLAQEKFTRTPHIRRFLTMSQNKNTPRIYKSVSKMFDNTSYFPLKHQLFADILVNAWAWIGPYFHFVLTQWNMRAVKELSVYFMTFEDLTCYIDEFMLMLDQKSTREIFAVFIENALSIRSTPADIDLLLSYLFNERMSENWVREYLLRFLMKVPRSLLMHSENAKRSLHTLLAMIPRSDEECTGMMVILIHLISGSNAHPLAVAAARAIRPQMINPVFIYTLSSLPTTPNGAPFACMLALMIGMDGCSMAITDLMELKYMEPYDNWYLWPLFMATLTIYEEDKINCGFFVGRHLHDFKDFEAAITFLEIIESSYKSMQLSIDGLIEGYMNGNEDQDFSKLAVRIIWSILFKLKGPSHSTEMRKAFQDSPFKENSSFVEHKKKVSSPQCADDMFSSIRRKLSFKHIRFNCDVSKGELVSKKRVEMCIRTLGRSSPNEYNLFLKGILESLMHKQSISHISNLEEFIDTQKVLYQNSLKAIYQKISSSMTEVFEQSLEIKTVRIEKPESREQLRKAKMVAMPIDLPTQIKRDMRACNFCCPMKLKSIGEKKTHKSKKRNDPPLYSARAFQLVFAGTKECVFKVYPEEIRLESEVHQKIINKNSVAMILVRTIQSIDCAIEIFKDNGKSYLVAFHSIDSSSALLALIQLKFPQMSIIQRFSSATMLSKLKVTQRWCLGQISNFQYIIKLNVIAGRSFNNPQAYPIFPQILKDFETKEIGEFSNIRKGIDLSLDRASPLFIKQSLRPAESLKKCFMDHPYVIADFFFFPDVVHSDDVLPPWAQNSFSFVYLLRKLLESEAVTRQLPKWIDRTFGTDAPSNGFQQILFGRSHPEKQQQPTVSLAGLPLLLDHPVRASAMIFDQSGRPTILVSDGLRCSMIKLNGDSLDVSRLKDLKCESISSCGGDFLVMSHKRHIGYVISNSGTNIVRVDTSTQLQSLCGDAIIFCSNNTTIEECPLPQSDRSARVLHVADHSISCLTTSLRFRMIVFSTAEYVHVLTLSGRWRASVDCGAEVKQVVVTSSFGFIVINTSHQIIVLDCNGRMIRRASHLGIRDLFPFTSSSDSDYVAFTDGVGVGCFEAFFPDRPQLFYEAPEPVASIVYDSHTESFLVITSDGWIHAIAQPI